MKNILSDAVTFSNEKAVLFKFEKKSKLAAYSVGIYCTLVELSESFWYLMDSQKFTGSLSIYRTFLENYVELKNLNKNQNYTDQLDYDNCRQEHKKLKSAKRGNLYLNSIAKYADSKLPKLKKDMNAIKKHSVAPILDYISDKFKVAGMNEEYTGLYPSLCAESHCSLEAIFTRHFEIEPETQKVKIVINSKDNAEDYDFYILNMANYLIHAGELLANILEGQQLEQFIEKRKEIEDSVK